MDQMVLQGSYWPADESRNVQNVSIEEALAQAAKAVPARLALVEVVPPSMGSPVKSAQTNREWTSVNFMAMPATAASADALLGTVDGRRNAHAGHRRHAHGQISLRCPCCRTRQCA
jgi:hypothetical protein